MSFQLVKLTQKHEIYDNIIKLWLINQLFSTKSNKNNAYASEIGVKYTKLFRKQKIADIFCEVSLE